METKESFTDSSYDLAKGLHHLLIAKQYIEVAAIGRTAGIKYFLNGIVNSIDNPINRIRFRLGKEELKEFDECFTKGDVLFTEEINNLMLQLSEEQKPIIEYIVKAMIKGETVNIEVDNKIAIENY